MTTPKQIEANRRNAAKSTGPKTARGKSFSRLNALSHGAFSQHLILLPGENAGEFTALRKAYRPSNQTEHFLVDRMIISAWRLARLSILEARIVETHYQDSENSASFNHDVAMLYRQLMARPKHLGPPRVIEIEPENPDAPPKPDPTARALSRDSNHGNAFQKLSRHQASLERSFYRALHELERLRAGNRKSTAKSK